MEPLKQALTYTQQIQRLREVHCLDIPDVNEAINILSVVNYYRLSGYGIGLKKTNNAEEYRDGVSIKTLYRLYMFDSLLRKSVLHIIEHIEIQLRTQIAYELSLAYGSECYTDPVNFVTKTKKDGTDIHSMIIDNFHKECERQKNLPFVQHHNVKYGGHFPLWVAVELFSFGTLSSLYDIMQTNDRNSVAKLYNTTPQHLSGWILAFLEVRNLCAHYGRLYNMLLKQSPYLYGEYRQYRSDKNRLFPVVIAIKAMMKGSSLYFHFLDELRIIMSDYSDVVNLSFIGFPEDWFDVLSKEDDEKSHGTQSKKKRTILKSETDMNIFSIPEQKDSPVYKKSPLIQTIFRVDYAENPLNDPDVLPRFKDSISDDFPDYNLQFPDVILQNSKSMPPEEKNFAFHHFRSMDQMDQIDIMTPYFSFMTLKYGCWENFKEKALCFFRVFSEICNSRPVRISLEFVNFLPDFLLLKEGKPLRTYVNPSLCGPMADYPFLVPPVTEYSGNLEWMIGNNDYLHLSYGSGTVQPTQKKMFFIDTTVFGFDDLQVTLPDRLDLYHARAYDAFRWSITEELDEYFRSN